VLEVFHKNVIFQCAFDGIEKRGIQNSMANLKKAFVPVFRGFP
jgi:hypothetical protein